MFDYSAWVRRAVIFTSNLKSLRPPSGEIQVEVGISPPLTYEDLESIRDCLDVDIPAELSRFWLEASSHCACKYVIGINPALRYSESTLYGGACFIDAPKLLHHIRDCREWGEREENAESYWLKSIPFLSMKNGDYLAILMEHRAVQHPVVYLSHDDESKIIAPSFTEFLHVWERLCYIGPEIWMIRGFLDEKGRLDADTQMAHLLRDLMSGLIPLLEPNIENISREELQEKRINAMKQIGLCAVMFISDEAGQLPDAEKWHEQFAAYNQAIAELTQLPGNPPTVCVMNSALSGLKEGEIVQPENSVLFFESIVSREGLNGSAPKIAMLNHWTDPAIFVTVDGKVHLLNKQEQENLKWSPD